MKRFRIACLWATCMGASIYAQPASPPAPAAAAAWNAKAAANYLDSRISWWMDWKSAARDHGTFCVSCHTAAPYALGRPALRAALAEQAPSPQERRLLDNVVKRVRLWKELEPFYPTKKESDPKTIESRGTESILNALILTNGAAPADPLSTDARLALDNMLGEQLKSGDDAGAWPWLQFHNSPWEGDSQYYGAALAAVALGSAPAGYRALPPVRDAVQRLSEYLVKERTAQIAINRVTLLWASAKLPGLLTREQQQAIIDEAFGRQQEDGGFTLSSLVGGWKRRDNTPLESKSDGYATGLVLFAVQQAGAGREQPRVQRGLAWLRANQDEAEGRWPAWSLNKQRELNSDAGRFMSDAATAYAVLALNAGK